MISLFDREESYEAMLFRLHESHYYGRGDECDDEAWCLRDDPDFDDLRAA